MRKATRELGNAKSAALLEEALAALGNTKSAERSRLLSRLGHASLIRSGALERATAQINEATRLARQLGAPRALLDALVSELLMGAFVPLRAGQFAKRRRLLEELSKITEQLGDVDLLPFFFHLSMPAYLEMGDLAAFEAQLTRFEELNAELLGGYLMTQYQIAAGDLARRLCGGRTPVGTGAGTSPRRPNRHRNGNLWRTDVYDPP